MADSSGSSQKRVLVARIGAAHGVRGEVRLWSYAADPLAVVNYAPLESEDGAQRFEFQSLRPSGKEFLVARFKGVADRTAAAQLNNVDLYAPRERLPEPDAADEFYHADLIGLAVVNVEGAPLGTVVAVQNFGAGDLIEIKPSGGGETVLLPFTESIMPVVDIAGGRIVADAPDELLRISPVSGEDDDVVSPPPERERARRGPDRIGAKTASSPTSSSWPAEAEHPVNGNGRRS